MSITLRLLAVLCACALTAQAQFLYDVFPDNFTWAVSTSSYQIEGGWDADGKGENIWDRFAHEGRCAENQTGDVACDSYNMWQDDIQILKNLGVDVYRFSLSWARMLPEGNLAGGINQAGIDYYNSLIDGLLAEGITPMLTLYHWDLPQKLQDYGGFWNDTLIQDFTDYAELAYQSFGDRVKLWLTFNEPYVIVWQGYGANQKAPGIYAPEDGAYRAGHVLLKAHAEAWHLYNDVYRASQGGQVSISLSSDWNEPNSTRTEDIDAAERAMQFVLGWFGHPVYTSTGNYPDVMITKVANKSAHQGYEQSRLPVFTPSQVDRIKGTYDFFGLNHYTTNLVFNKPQDIGCVSYACDSDTGVTWDPTWPTTGSSWLRVVPWGLRSLLNWIRDAYGDVPIIITENGCSDNNGTLEDTQRVNWYRDYINEALKANQTDNVNLVGYTAWSLMDNFEWVEGYLEKFGLHYVNFSDPSLHRVPKQSATEYAQIIRDNGFPAPRSQKQL